jgi:hypothetical protein
VTAPHTGIARVNPDVDAMLWPFLAAMPALAVVVLAHEGGHCAGYVLFGFPHPVLHSDSASFATQDAFWTLLRDGQRGAANALHPLWHVGTAVAAGIGMTLVSFIVAWRALRARATRAFWLAVALLAPIRFLVGIPAVVAWITARPLTPGSDEGELSLLLGWHPGPLALGGLGVMVGAWLLVARQLRRSALPLRFVAATMVGAVVGGVLYAQWLGPWMLG